MGISQRVSGPKTDDPFRFPNFLEVMLFRSCAASCFRMSIGTYVPTTTYSGSPLLKAQEIDDLRASSGCGFMRHGYEIARDHLRRIRPRSRRTGARGPQGSRPAFGRGLEQADARLQGTCAA